MQRDKKSSKRKRSKSSSKRPNSRYFREYFLRHLNAVKRDNEAEEISRKFFVDTELFFEPEATTDLPGYFKRAGLDYTAPGHWQFLLIALTNAVHREHTGRKPISPEEDRRFMLGMTKLKLKNPTAKGRALCKLWAESERAHGRQPADPESLRTTRLQPLLRQARKRVAAGNASHADRKFLAVVGPNGV